MVYTYKDSIINSCVEEFEAGESNYQSQLPL